MGCWPGMPTAACGADAVPPWQVSARGRADRVPARRRHPCGRPRVGPQLHHALSLSAGDLSLGIGGGQAMRRSPDTNVSYVVVKRIGGATLPAHTHPRAAEMDYVVDGVLTLVCGGVSVGARQGRRDASRGGGRHYPRGADASTDAQGARRLPFHGGTRLGRPGDAAVAKQHSRAGRDAGGHVARPWHVAVGGDGVLAGRRLFCVDHAVQSGGARACAGTAGDRMMGGCVVPAALGARSAASAGGDPRRPGRMKGAAVTVFSGLQTTGRHDKGGGWSDDAHGTLANQNRQSRRDPPFSRLSYCGGRPSSCDGNQSMAQPPRLAVLVLQHMRPQRTPRRSHERARRFHKPCPTPPRRRRRRRRLLLKRLHNDKARGV